MSTGVRPNRIARPAVVASRIALVASVLMFGVIAVSNAAYDVTTPTSLPHHTLVRKTLAIVAFSVCGAFYAGSEFWLRGVAGTGVAIGMLSLVVEIGQVLIDHVPETFGQHAFDVASGVAGGLIGALLVAAARPRS